MEGAPAAYCRCATCQGVRQRRGVELRTRSSVRLSLHHQIDVSPDQYTQTIAAGLDMYDVEHVLVTHTHEDHFTLPALMDKQMSVETNGRPLTVYLSSQAHSSVEKAALLAGFGRANVRVVATDPAHAMRADALDEAIRNDLAAGRKPCAVVATAQLPILPPSSLVITTVAERGRFPAAPSGHELKAFGLAGSRMMLRKAWPICKPLA